MPSTPDITTSKKSERVRRKKYLLEGTRFKHEEVREALFHIQDAMDRAQLRFVLLDEVADQIAYREDPLLEASEVSIGIRRGDFTESGSSTLRSLIPEANWKDFIHGFPVLNLSYTCGSVPITIWMIDNDLGYFKNPDVRFYLQTEFLIPNPFKEYWQKRDLIQ